MSPGIAQHKAAPRSAGSRGTRLPRSRGRGKRSSAQRKAAPAPARRPAAFQTADAGHPVIMGRKTWESIKGRCRTVPISWYAARFHAARSVASSLRKRWLCGGPEPVHHRRERVACALPPRRRPRFDEDPPVLRRRRAFPRSTRPTGRKRGARNASLQNGTRSTSCGTSARARPRKGYAATEDPHLGERKTLNSGLRTNRVRRAVPM